MWFIVAASLTNPSIFMFHLVFEERIVVAYYKLLGELQGNQ
jgi:hypothetical protein